MILYIRIIQYKIQRYFLMFNYYFSIICFVMSLISFLIIVSRANQNMFMIIFILNCYHTVIFVLV